MKHIPALDGIRGVAILLVMLFHLKLPGFSLGWAGVPLFFVLSGFLITGILLEEKTATFSEYLRAFYVKRSLRIFPLFYGYLALNLVILLVTGRPTDGYAWYVLYFQNYQIANAIATDGNIPGIVGHTWSLAVEEQFYLIWPFLVYYFSRRQLAWTCVVLIVASPLARLAILHISGNESMAILTLPSCLDMMAYGALLSLLRNAQWGSKAVSALFLAGAAITGIAIFQLGLAAFWNSSTWVRQASYLYTSLAFIFGIAIWAAAVKPMSLWVKLLSIKPLLYTGKISYGLYIWHYIIFLAFEKLATKLSFMALPMVTPVLAIAASYIVATLSFYLFELYFLRMKDRFTEKSRASRLRQAAA